MAVPFYIPEASEDASSSGDGSSTSSSQSPNTTSSATQTPLQSPVNGEHLVMAFCEALYRCSINNASPVFQYPPPASPSCSVHSPSGTYTGGEVFFPRGRSTPRTPRTSISFWGGDEISFFRPHHHHHHHSSSVPSGPPQSAPPIPPSQHLQQNQHHQYQQQSSHHNLHHPNQHQQQQQQQQQQQLQQQQQQHQSTSAVTMGNSGTTTGTGTFGMTATTRRLHRSHSDVSRRPRLTSTGEDEHECLSEHETSWDEYDDRYDNFTAGRERLQEFNGRIPPRKKKKDVPKPKPKSREQSFTWPTVVTVFVFAMGCGFLVAR